MPIYSYRCENCGHQKDVLQKISDPLLVACPSCHQQTLKKQVTAAGFQLKGSGWYVTDFRNPPAKDGAKAGGEKTTTPGTADASDAPAKAGDGKDSAAPAAAPAASPATATSDAKPAASPPPATT